MIPSNIPLISFLNQGTATAPIVPTDIPGLLAWWDSSDVSTLFTGTYADRLISTANPTTNLDPLCRQEDKSGNANNLTCAADATRPTYNTVGTLNGLSGVTIGVWGRPALASTAKTWFQVHRYSGATVDTRLNTDSTSKTSLGIGSPTSWRLSFVREGTAWIDSGFTQGTSARIYRTEYVSGGNSTFWTAVSGVETQRQTTALLGSGSPAIVINFPGDLFETLVYGRTLTAPEVTAVHAYLTAKWGI